MELNSIMFMKVTIIFGFIGFFVGLYCAWQECNKDGLHIAPFICLPIMSTILCGAIPTILLGAFYAIWFLVTK